MAEASAYDVAVDIHDLLVAGRRKMPAMAAQYQAAEDGLVTGTVGFALQRDPSLGIGPTGILPEWGDCLREVRAMLRQEAATMQAIGEALEHIALKEFRDTDDGVREQFTQHYGKLEK